MQTKSKKLCFKDAISRAPLGYFNFTHVYSKPRKNRHNLESTVRNSHWFLLTFNFYGILFFLQSLLVHLLSVPDPVCLSGRKTPSYLLTFPEYRHGCKRSVPSVSISTLQRGNGGQRRWWRWGDDEMIARPGDDEGIARPGDGQGIILSGLKHQLETPFWIKSMSWLFCLI